jgi:hypothetical protein
MMKLKIFLIGIFGFILLSGLTSCNTDVEPYGEAGAYIATFQRLNEDTDTYETMYQLRLWADGNKAIASVDVMVGLESYKLTPTSNSGQYNLDKDCDATLSCPFDEDLCIFDFNFSSGETYRVTTTLAPNLQSPNITSLVYDSSTSSYTVTWDPIIDAKYLEIIMYDDDLEPKAGIFSSGIFSNSTTTSYKIVSGSGSWMSGYPTNNRNLILEIRAYTFDQFSYYSALSISKPWYFTWGTNID